MLKETNQKTYRKIPYWLVVYFNLIQTIFFRHIFYYFLKKVIHYRKVIHIILMVIMVLSLVLKTYRLYNNKKREQIEGETKVIEKTIKNEVEKEAVKKDVQSEPLSINLKQAYSLYKKNTLFIDAREPEDYRLAHIKNAINLPMDHFDDYKSMLEKIDKDQPIVTYCAGTDCDLSIVLSNVLYDMGYKKLYIFFGGWNEWLNAKYPTETSESEE